MAGWGRGRGRDLALKLRVEVGRVLAGDQLADLLDTLFHAHVHGPAAELADALKPVVQQHGSE